MSTAGNLRASFVRSGALRQVDGAFADLLQRLGAPAEVALAGALAMRAVALGHSGIVIDAVSELLSELDTAWVLPEPQAWAAALRRSPLVAVDTCTSAPLVFENGMLALRRYARYEQRLADALCKRVGIQQAAIDSAALSRLFELRPGPADRQALAAWSVQQQQLTLITGGPGTGKTSTVARILVLLAAQMPDLRIALAAPTGRAAARLGEAVAAALARDITADRLTAQIAAHIPTQAQTLHRLLGWRRDGSFRHGAALPLPYDVVVVDEASMIDLPMMAKLVDAVATQTRLILLGDPDQLPAVEAGDVLGALCMAAGDGRTVPAAFKRLHATASAGDDGRSSLHVDGTVPATRMDADEADADEADAREADVRKVDARETDGDAADRREAKAREADAREVDTREKEAQYPAAVPLAGHRVHLLRGYRQINAAGIATLAEQMQAGDHQGLDAALRSGLDGVDWIDLTQQAQEATTLAQWLEADVLPGYRALAQAADPAQALSMASRTRVLTALRHGRTGAQRYNAWFAQRLGGANPWFQGRLIMVTANSYRHGLFNGDIGVCWQGPDSHPRIWFEQDGRLRAWSPGQLPPHETAFASTVHRAQGSEFDHVWLVLPGRDHRLLTRQLVYTGITRARRSLHLVASQDVLAAALQRKAMRWSGLAWRLAAAARARESSARESSAVETQAAEGSLPQTGLPETRPA